MHRKTPFEEVTMYDTQFVIFIDDTLGRWYVTWGSLIYCVTHLDL